MFTEEQFFFHWQFARIIGCLTAGRWQIFEQYQWNLLFKIVIREPSNVDAWEVKLDIKQEEGISGLDSWNGIPILDCKMSTRIKKAPCWEQSYMLSNN